MTGRTLELHPVKSGKPQEALSRSDKFKLWKKQNKNKKHDYNSIKRQVHTLEVDFEAGFY